MKYARRINQDGTMELLIEGQWPCTRLFIRLSRESGEILRIAGIDDSLYLDHGAAPAVHIGGRISADQFGLPVLIGRKGKQAVKAKAAGRLPLPKPKGSIPNPY